MDDYLEEPDEIILSDGKMLHISVTIEDALIWHTCGFNLATGYEVEMWINNQYIPPTMH